LYLQEMDREDSPTAAEREENLHIFVSFIHGGHHTAGSPPPHVRPAGQACVVDCTKPGTHM